MIVALMLGREGSTGFPGKNLMKVRGRRLMEYPLLAAKASKHIDAFYISTDSPGIKKVGRKHGVQIIDRPDYLCTKEALGDDAYVHGYELIKKENLEEIELVVLLFCNAITITTEAIDEGIAALRADPSLDSAVTVSRYNMWSPLRARKLDDEGLLQPFVPFETFGDPKTLNCDRDSQGDVFFADMGVSIVRPRCLEALSEGMLPQKWMGQRIHPIRQEGGFDIDYAWQLPGIEWWIDTHFKKNKKSKKKRS
ncbi:MAG: cytidylyltransferase [Magnetococcales bacterium]|nr:cytidylyltransferase [Magnetococcales bacterium]